MLNIDLYYRVSRYAAQCHAQQLFPGLVVPYYLHLSQVATEVLYAYQLQPDFDLDLAHSCALLHDTIEDTQAEYTDLLDAFGPAIADGVAALTKDEALERPERMPDSIRRILLQPREIALVKMADRCANMQSPPLYWNNDKRQSYRQEAIYIHQQLAWAHPPLAQHLWERIENYQNFIEK